MDDIKILPTAYMPPIDYMSIIAKERKIFIEAKETYPKQTYRNRCEILTSNGKMSLHVHTSKPYGNHSTTDTILLSYSEPWNIQHWRAIQSAYSASPYFIYYSDKFRTILENRHATLLEINNSILKEILNILKIETEIEYTSEYKKTYNPENDYRTRFSPKRDKDNTTYKKYHQVFEDRLPFYPNLSVLDLIFNIGAESKKYILSI